MKTRIKNEREFGKVIDEFGRLQNDIKFRREKVKALKALLESYANAMKCWKYVTDTFQPLPITIGRGPQW